MKPKYMKAKYVGSLPEPAPGTIGAVFQAIGFYDPESADFQAYVFFPDDGDGIGYYTNGSDLELFPA